MSPPEAVGDALLMFITEGVAFNSIVFVPIDFFLLLSLILEADLSDY